jgi:protease-4
MKKDSIFGIIVVAFIVFVIVFSLVKGTANKKVSVSTPQAKTGSSISVISLNGVIGEGTSASVYGATSGITVSDVKTLLDEAKSDPSKALIIEINSPGGAVEPTQEIYDAIVHFKKETGKKVYVWMRGEAASGGYYISCAADKIIAMPTTLTGSIGVIMELVNYEGLFEKLGLKETVIKSGKFKDMGSPVREMTKEEREMLQNIINETYQQFFNVVESARHIPENELKQIAQGQVYTGIQAKKLNLVDANGNFQFVVDTIKKDLHLSGSPQIIRHNVQRNFLYSLLGGKTQLEQELGIINNLKPMKLQYVMQP